MALYTLAPQPWLIFLDDAGIYLPNGQLAIYAAGTTTPATVYTSATGTAHPFPITLDGAGRVPGGLYLQPGQNYKFVLHAPMIEEPLDGDIIKSQDNVGAVPRSGGSVLTLSTPGDYANVDVAGVDIIEYTGAGDITIHGLSGGVLGQSILIRNLSQNAVMWLSPEDAVAVPGASLRNFFAVGRTPLVGERSSARYTYLSVGLWVMEGHAMGRPLTPPYDAANYGTGGAGGPMTWTVDPSDVIYETFFMLGRSLIYNFHFNAASISGTPQQYLTRLLPFGWRALGINTLAGIVVSYDGGVTYPIGVSLVMDLTHVGFAPAPFGGGWTPNTNATIVAGRLEFLLA